METKREKGFSYEDLACEYLIKTKKFKLIQKQFQAKTGEIDLIMLDPNRSSPTLVFIEVRFRSSQAFGKTEETVDYQKKMRLIRTAAIYLQKKNLFDKIPCRFDIVAISDFPKPQKSEFNHQNNETKTIIKTKKFQKKLQWIPNAFEAF